MWRKAFPLCIESADVASVANLGTPCPCIDRSRLHIAGVVHGVEGDTFWDDVFSAAYQAALDMNVNFEMERYTKSTDDTSLPERLLLYYYSCMFKSDSVISTMKNKKITMLYSACFI